MSRNRSEVFFGADESSEKNDLEFLEMAPEDLANYLEYLDGEGKLEVFLDKVLDTPEGAAQLSYWQKWFSKEHIRLLDEIIAQKSEAYKDKENPDVLPLELETRYSAEQLDLIFSNTKAIQLTQGCSKGCVFCGFDAIAKVREHIPYTQLENMFRQFGPSFNKGKPFLYWASEPSDYASRVGLEDRTYEDVHDLAVRYSHYSPGITTREVDKSWLEFLGDKKKDGDVRISAAGIREDRFTQLLNDIQKVDLNPFMNLAGTVRHAEGAKAVPFVKGMGVSARKEGYPSKDLMSGIACVDGILITPRGLYNMVVVPISREFPQGTIIKPLQEIEDRDVVVGANISEYLSSMVVMGRYSHEGAYSEKDLSQKYIGTFPKDVILDSGKNRHYATIEANGYIQSSKTFEDLEVVGYINDAFDGKNDIKVTLPEGFSKESFLKILSNVLDGFSFGDVHDFHGKVTCQERFRFVSNNGGYAIDISLNKRDTNITGRLEMRCYTNETNKE